MLPMDGPHLSQLLAEAASRRPDHPAVLDEHGRTLSFAALLHGADRLATRLCAGARAGRPGRPVPAQEHPGRRGHSRHPSLWGGLRARRSDRAGPARGSIFADGGVKAVVVDSSLAAALCDAWRGPGPLPRLIMPL